MARLVAVAMLVTGTGAMATEWSLGLSPDMPKPVEQGLKIFVDAANADATSALAKAEAKKLINARQVFALLKAGRLDLAAVPTEVVAGTVAEFMIFQAGFLFDTAQDLGQVWREDDFGQDWNRRLIEVAGVRVIGILPAGARNLVIREKRVQSLADLTDLRVRTLPNAMSAAVTLAAKAHPVPVSERHLVSELKDGAIDGFETTLARLSAFSEFPDLTVLATAHQFDSYVLLVREAVWQGLSEERRTVWTQSTQQVTDALADAAAADEASLRKALEERGVAFSRLPPPDLKVWADDTREGNRGAIGRRLGRDHPALKLFD
jgi:TRAP-type transport system periplasmic protein